MFAAKTKTGVYAGFKTRAEAVQYLSDSGIHGIAYQYRVGVYFVACVKTGTVKFPSAA